jgi:putative transposase
VKANQAIYGVATMCRVLEVSASGYYAWQQRPPSARSRADAELSSRITAIHHYSRATYGAPRIHEELLAAGIHVGRKRVARLMKATGLSGVSRRRWVTTAVRDTNAPPAPDLVERNFSASGPNRLRVADISYLPTWTGFLYLAVVLDGFSRRIVGWARETSVRTELVRQALHLALGQRRPGGVIHHFRPGQSVLLRSPSINVVNRPACGPQGVPSAIASITRCARVSWPRSNANCSTAAASNPKAQHASQSSSSSEGWYNPHRRHSALDYLSPINYERSHSKDPGYRRPTPSIETG